MPCGPVDRPEESGLFPGKLTRLFPDVLSGSGASAASHRRLGLLLLYLEGLLEPHHHDNQSGRRGSFQVSNSICFFPPSQLG